MWEKILYIAGGIELFVGGLMQSYPEMIPNYLQFYGGWAMMVLGIATAGLGVFLHFRKCKLAVHPQVSFMHLISVTNSSGWDASAKNEAIINLLTKFQEGLISGSLSAYGRQASLDWDESVRRSQPLVLITTEYWNEHELEPTAVFSGDRNINLRTMAKNNTIAADKIYFDIHLDDEAIAWLELGLEQWDFAKATDIYVGHVSCNLGKLEDEGAFSYFIRGYNGSNVELSFSEINGHADYVEIIGETSIDKGALPTPRFHGNLTVVEPNAEFTVQINQMVPKSLLASMKAAIDGGSLQIRFVALDIIIKQEHSKLRLPLWDGITVSREGGNVSTNRLFVLKAETGIYKSRFGEQEVNA
jgi:hypothetical protein